MADTAAINVVVGLVRAAMYIAQAISDAVDEANTLAELLPLVQAGLFIINDAMQKNLVLKPSAKAGLDEYLDRLGKNVATAGDLLKQASAHIAKSGQPAPKKGDQDALRRFKTRLARDKWLLIKRGELQTSVQSITSARANLDLILVLIEKGSEFDPTEQLLDVDARKFWLSYFGKAPSVKWTHFFQSLRVYNAERSPPQHIGNYEEAVRRVLGACWIDPGQIKGSPDKDIGVSEIAPLDQANDGEVTPLGFQTFLNWFGPLQHAAFRAGELGSKSYFCGVINSDLAEDMLQGLEDGAFLVRWSIGQTGKFAVSYRQHGKYVKSLIHTHGERGCSFEMTPLPTDLAPTIPALIAMRPDLFKASALDILQERGSEGDIDAMGIIGTAINRGVTSAGLSSSSSKSLAGGDSRGSFSSS